MNADAGLGYVTPIALSVLAVLCGCSPKDLTEKPPRQATSAPFATATSVVGAEASIKLADLKALVDSKMPKQYSAGGNGPDLCADLGLLGKHCAGTQYDFNAQVGASTLSAVNGSTIRLAVPVSFSGHGGFRGDGCRLLSCNAKSFQGGARVNIDISPAVGADWCPTLNANVTYTFDPNPRVEIAGGVWVDVSGQVRGKVDAQMEELRKTINSAVDCGLVKRELAKVYVSRSFTIAMPDNGAAYVNVTPQGLGLASPAIDAERVRISALVAAKVEISDKPVAATALPLPPNQAIPPGPPLTRVAVPLRASYDTLAKLAHSSIAGKTFESNTPAGKVKVTVKDVEIYPSGERVVVGIKVKADLPTRWLDTSGDVYMFARPVVDSPTRIRLTDIGFARKLDNEFWVAASALFETQIVGALSDVAQYDLAHDIENARNMLDRALKEPNATPGVHVTVNDVSMGLGRVAVAEKELAIEGLFSARVSLSPTP